MVIIISIITNKTTKIKNKIPCVFFLYNIIIVCSEFVQTSFAHNMMTSRPFLISDPKFLRTNNDIVMTLLLFHRQRYFVVIQL